MFKTSKISFCNQQACNIVEDSSKEEILDILQKNYYVSIKDKNFYIINSRNIKYIEKNPHFLSIKSSGSLYYLFLTNIDGNNYCFFIDKRVKDGHKYPRMISVNYRFSGEIFNNTLFDGELLRDKDENWLYIINNIVLYKGKLMKDKHINYKLNLVYDILTNHYQRDEHLELCPLYVKRLFANHEFDYMIKNYIPNLNYNCRGIYFEGIRNLSNHLYLFPRGHKFNKPITNEIGASKSESSKSGSSKSESSKSESSKSGSSKSEASKSGASKSEASKSESSKSESSKSESSKSGASKHKVIKQVNVSDRKYMRFMVKKTDISDIYNIYCMKDDDIYKYGGAHIPNLKTSKYMRNLFNNGEDNITMNCEFNSKMEKWTPVEVTNELVDDLSSIEMIYQI